MLSDRNGLGRVAVLSGIAYFLLSTASAPEELAPQNGDVASGQQMFNNFCRTCHSTKGDNRLGPHVWGIIGRKAGSLYWHLAHIRLAS